MPLLNPQDALINKLLARIHQLQVDMREFQAADKAARDGVAIDYDAEREMYVNSQLISELRWVVRELKKDGRRRRA